jgi:hypothetical protein
MIAAILTFLRGSAVTAPILAFGLAVLVAVILDLRLESVTAARDLAIAERDAALAEGLRWRKAYNACAGRASGLQTLARECLDREAGAAADAAERESIIRWARTAPRNEIGDQGVVDDTTRRRAVDRLNRPL